MKYLNIIVILFIIGTTSCNGGANKQTEKVTVETQAPKLCVIDMDGKRDDVDLRLSDLMSNIKIVTIKNDNNLVISAEYSAVTNNRIIINNQKSILQFDYDGNYISTLALKGRGPKEFSNAKMIFITDSTSKVYIPEFSSKSIMSVDLLNGETNKITASDIFGVKFISNKEKIYGRYKFTMVGDGNDKILFMILDMNNNGKNITIRKKYDSRHKWGENYLSLEDNIIFFNHGYCDTIYNVIDSTLIPKTVLQMKNIEEEDGTINALEMEYWYKDGLILNWTKYGAKEISAPTIKTANSKLSKPNILQNYYLIDNNNILHNIKSFTIDPLGLTINVSEFISAKNSNKISNSNIINLLPEVSGSHAYYKFEAYEFKKLIQQALLNEALDNTKRTLLGDLDKNLLEDSNPVYIIGKINN